MGALSLILSLGLFQGTLSLGTPLPILSQIPAIPQPAGWHPPVERYIGPLLRQHIGGTTKGLAPALPDGGPAARHIRAAKAVSFKAVPERLVPDRVAAEMKGLDAKGRKAAARSFRELLATYEKGAPKHDVAEALAFCLGTCQQVARGRDLSREEAQELSLRMTGLLPGMAEFAGMNDRDRQAMYESLILTGGLVGGLAKQAADQGDAATARHAQTMARQVLGLFGMDVE